MTLAQDLKRREKANSRHPAPHLTHMIAESLIAPGELDVTKFRDYGLGERDASTLPGAKINSESEYANRKNTRYWENLRRKAQSNVWIGHKY